MTMGNDKSTKIRLAIYPGSFNPFHEGHLDVIKKVLPMVDRLYVACGRNPSKKEECVFNIDLLYKFKARDLKYGYGYDLNPGSSKIEFHVFDGLFTDYVNLRKDMLPATTTNEPHEVFVVRGLRSSADFEAEKTQQYWYEDLGLNVPILYVIGDRSRLHLSSSAIRAVKKLKNEED